jgi:cysteine dioxygenase
VVIRLRAGRYNADNQDVGLSTMLSLAELFRELDGYAGRVPLDVLEERLRQLAIEPAEIGPHVKFNADTYRRNLMHAGQGYHALILCWRAGQRSPIHDHNGSSCGVRVLSGTCTETIFDRTPAGHIYPTHTHHLHAGHCCGSQDSDIHQISNIDPSGTDLVTLHVYSPPLLAMGQYSLSQPGRTEFVDAIHSFAEGAGI